MVKFRCIFVMLILILWLAGSGCAEKDTDVKEASIAPEIPGAEINENTSAGQELTEADVHEFEENITDLENLLENSTEEIVVEEL